MCNLFTCDIFLINAWRSNQNPSIYNQHKQRHLSDMLLTAWTHKQLDTVIYSTKVLARWKSGGKKHKSQLSVTFSDCVISLGQYVWEVGRWKKINLAGVWFNFSQTVEWDI